MNPLNFYPTNPSLAEELVRLFPETFHRIQSRSTGSHYRFGDKPLLCDVETNPLKPLEVRKIIGQESERHYRFGGRSLPCDFEPNPPKPIEVRRKIGHESERHYRFGGRSLPCDFEPNPPKPIEVRRKIGHESDNIKECGFCKKNGEQSLVYQSHTLRSADGKVLCPILRSYKCPLCKNEGGDKAHTIMYCPLKSASLRGVQPIANALKTPRTSTRKR